MTSDLTRRAMLAGGVGFAGAAGLARRAREPHRQTEVLSREPIDY